jgi:hypothetical protein
MGRANDLGSVSGTDVDLVFRETKSTEDRSSSQFEGISKFAKIRRKPAEEMGRVQPEHNALFSKDIPPSSSPPLQKQQQQGLYDVEGNDGPPLILQRNFVGVSNYRTEEADQSDIESLPSINDDISSSSDTISSNSTVSSSHSTVVEVIVSRFIEDGELAGLYEDAMKRMDNARFVRNQKRLLKRLFLDLRAQARTPLQQQAIKILRGRAERITIAEHIWSTIRPSSPSKEPDMAASTTQKVDKKSQLERLLGPQTGTNTNIPEDDALSQASEESDGSNSESSNFAETKYPNVELATAFLVGGGPYKKYITNFRNFPHLDSGVWGPVTLHECVVKGDIGAVTKLLEEHFNDVAQLEFDWLHELLEIGCMCEEIARLLIDGENASPWILLDHITPITPVLVVGYHQKNCVHSGGQRLDMSARIITTKNPPIQEQTGVSTVRDRIGELCGIGGGLPLAPNGPEVGSDVYHWIECVRFSGENNSVASIGYATDVYYPAYIGPSPVLRIINVLQRSIAAFAVLQENGLCCDAFTILRLLETKRGSSYIELCNLDIVLLNQMRLGLETWISDTTNITNLDSCAMGAGEILSVFCGGAPDVEFFSASPFLMLHICALAVQCVTVGIHSYSQGHTGPLHPSYLVDDLKELRLLGNALEPRTSPPFHVAVKLLDFTCMKGMVQDSILVFVPTETEDNKPRFQAGFDLSASPEDLAVTWAPARFIAGDSGPGEPRKLFAIEIGGGTITYADQQARKFHWSSGSKSYETFKLTFNSKDKVLIGGATINDECPLDETESWRHPATNAYLRHLGTHESSWELRELQAGLQGGQYAVLAFNSTFVKQPGVTLKQQQLMLPSNEIDIAFLNSTCGLQISFCTGVARRVELRE